MPRIPAVRLNDAPPAVAGTLAGVQARLGMLPNVVATFAQSPAALKGYLAFSGALAGGRLTPRQREVVALAVAQANQCEYCLAAHTAIGRSVGLTDEEARAARDGHGTDALENALAAFASAVVRQRALVSDAELNRFRARGLDDELIVETLAHVALNVLTNYTNHVAATDVDFPAVPVEV